MPRAASPGPDLHLESPSPDLSDEDSADDDLVPFKMRKM